MVKKSWKRADFGPKKGIIFKSYLGLRERLQSFSTNLLQSPQAHKKAPATFWRKVSEEKAEA